MLHYTALHCTALHWRELHCTALHCTALHCTALHCTTLHCTALHCTALHCTALHCTALHCLLYARFFFIILGHSRFRRSSGSLKTNFFKPPELWFEEKIYVIQSPNVSESHITHNKPNKVLLIGFVKTPEARKVVVDFSFSTQMPGRYWKKLRLRMLKWFQ